MRCVVAMNAFKGSLSPVEATRAVSEGWRRGYPSSQVIESPMADGGDGTLEVLVSALGGAVQSVSVRGPYGRRVAAKVGVLDEGQTVVIESAQASGLALAPPNERDIWKAHSRGVGELLVWAAASGAKSILVGIGGTAMNDCGIGAVQAAGGKVLDSSGRDVALGLKGLSQVSRVSLGDIPRLLGGVSVVAMCDVQNVLCGDDGATMVYGPQKGLSPRDAALADSHMFRYARVLGRDLGRDPAALPMAGAGGGLGAALWAFCGAELVHGSQYIMKRTMLKEKIKGADLVVTGEGQVDSQTAKGKVPASVADAAGNFRVPTVVIGGGIDDSVVLGSTAPFAAAFSSTPRPMGLETAVEQAQVNLSFISEQLGRICRVVRSIN